MFSAQLDVSNAALLELEENIYHKSFSKKWKKTKQAEWEKKCKEAEDINAINTLFNEYSDLLAQSASFSMGNSDAETELDFAKYLIRVEATLTNEITSKWAASDREKWKSELLEFIEKKEQKFKEEELMRKFHVVTGIVKGFEKNFPIVWADAKKNSFKSIITGDVKAGKNNTSIKFKGGGKERITEDAYHVKSFIVFFDTEGDLQMADKILVELELLIVSEVGEGYKKTNDHDDSYSNNNKFIYQYEGEKFAETAKRPTVTIGVQIEKPGVYVEITEPVFGH
jgi:hypothetical protein